MVEILKRAKPLAVNPLKASQPIGAALAFLGLRRAIPMLHGSQGCTAFGKVFLVRHFREPIPLQTTAMDQVSSIMSADENVIEGLRVLCEKELAGNHRPADHRPRPKRRVATSSGWCANSALAIRSSRRPRWCR
jgi:hypothetical protein